mgnify:CR=1 FL=1|jgi:hypothetical protein
MNILLTPLRGGATMGNSMSATLSRELWGIPVPQSATRSQEY